MPPTSDAELASPRPGRAERSTRSSRAAAALALAAALAAALAPPLATRAAGQGAGAPAGGGRPAAVLRAPVPDRVVVLTFDDAVVSHATHVAPLLARYGFGATFFVTEFVQPPFADTSLYMTWERIRALNQMGFEIGNHTAHHTHVPRMDAAQLAADLATIEQRGVGLGIPKPLSFAYPAYETSPGALPVLAAQGYVFARVGGDRAYDPARDHPLLVPSFSTGADDGERILRAFREARDGKIVVLTVHGVPDTAHPWVSTPPARFDAYMQYLHDNGYTVLALRDLAQFVDPVRARAAIPPRF